MQYLIYLFWSRPSQTVAAACGMRHVVAATRNSSVLGNAYSLIDWHFLVAGIRVGQVK